MNVWPPSAEAISLIAFGLKLLAPGSSVGAELPEGTGLIAGVHVLEQLVDKIAGVHVVHLRPGYFMENHLHQVGMIKGMGINGSPLLADLPIGMVATRDIAAVAAEYLANPTFTGREVRYLLGPRDWQDYMAEFRTAIMANQKLDGSFAPTPTHESQALHSNTDHSVGPCWTTATFGAG